MLYSSKYAHTHTLKAAFFTTSTGLILYMAPLFGGAAPEIATAQAFYSDCEASGLPEFKDLFSSPEQPPIHLYDRGYRDLKPPADFTGWIWLPTNLGHRAQFQPEFLKTFLKSRLARLAGKTVQPGNHRAHAPQPARGATPVEPCSPLSGLSWHADR